MVTQLTQKYTILTLLEPVEEGVEFASTDWPRHVSIAETFAIDLNGTDILGKLALLIESQGIFETTVGGDEYFGPENNTHVMILHMSK